jgi:hypothetical protein
MVARVLAGLTACALFSCSSSGGGSGGACGAVAPCGGKVVGTWNASDVCITGETTTMMISATCAATVSASPHVSGTATFNSDGTFTSSTTINISTSITIPAACLNQGATTLSCDQIGPAIATAVGGGASAACSSAGGGCSCTLTEAAKTDMSSGTYATNGDSITTTDTTGTSAISSGNYCVMGGSLHLISTSMGTGIDGGATTSTVDVVLTK